MRTKCTKYTKIQSTPARQHAHSLRIQIHHTSDVYIAHLSYLLGATASARAKESQNISNYTARDWAIDHFAKPMGLKHL
jgi:hypothetical protein